MPLQHLRSSTANKRPTPAGMSDGQLALNTNNASPGLFFKDSNGALVKVGPVHVGATAPNATPGAGGSSGNAIGEQWLDTAGGTYVFKVWDGSAWRSETGTFVDVNGDVMTGALGIIAGSAGSPGLYISGDANTGVFSPSADALALSTGGSERLRITSAGLVGVGTGAPGTILDIRETATGATTAISLFNTDNTNSTSQTARIGLSPDSRGAALTGLEVYKENADFSTSAARDVSLAFNVLLNNAKSEAVRITSAGLVGIGTSSPTVPLHIDGTTAQTYLQVGPSTGDPLTSKTIIADIRGDSATNGAGPGLRLWAGVSAAEIYATRESGGAASTFSVDTRSGGALSTALFIDSSRRVGIGTTSPLRLWHALDSANSIVGRVESGQSSSWLQFAASGNGTASRIGSPDGASTASLAFMTNDQERARIDSSGRLLVGTSSSASTGAFSQYALFQVRGNSSSAASSSIFSLQRGEGASSITSGESLGLIDFADNAGNSFGYISCDADGTAGSGDYPGRLVFSTTADGASSPTERMRLDSTGRMLVGATSARSNINLYSADRSPTVQIETAVATSNNGLSLINNNGSGWEPVLTLATSAGSSVGSNTVVANNSAVGSIAFAGNDGDQFLQLARITAQVDGTPGNNDMPGRLTFHTTADGASSPTERMRITQDGDVFINHNSSNSPVVGGEKLGVLGGSEFAIAAQTTLNTKPTIYIANTSDTNNAYVARFSTGSGGNTRGEIYYNGSQLVYATSSDYRLKENVVSFDDGIEIVKQLRPVRYNWIENGNEDIGFIAHEVQAVFPNAVGGEKDAVDDNGKILPQTYDPSKLVPLLTAALQEAVEKIESLEARLTAAGI